MCDEIMMAWRECRDWYRCLSSSTATSYINMNTCFQYSEFHFHLCDRSTLVGQFFSVTALYCCTTFMMARFAAAPLRLPHVLGWFSLCTAATSRSLLGCRSGHLPHLFVERVDIWESREWLLDASKRTWLLTIEVVSADETFRSACLLSDW
jgi:hypothetical protein